jgi:peptide chain release factor 2
VSELSDKVKAARSLHGELRRSLKIEERGAERAKLERDMEKPDFWSNQETAQKTVQALKGVKSALEPFETVSSDLENLEVLLELAEAENDAATLAECERELAKVERGLERLKLRSLFTHENDESSVVMNLQAGAGGVDAADWTRMVVRMLTRYAENKGFKVTPEALDPDPMAGFRSAVLSIEGRGAYGWLRGLQGTMRLVRISPFDAQARRQTGFCAVEVLPESDDEKAIEIKDADLKWETFASGGPGGQHVNKTQSGVRVRHVPSGVMVECTEQRNQGANKKRALKILGAKLANLEAEKKAAAAAEAYEHKSVIGFGASDRIFSVTLQPFTLVKDTRTGWQTSDTTAFLDGDLDGLIEAYLKWAASGGKVMAGTAGD